MKYDLAQRVKIKMIEDGIGLLPTPAIGIIRDINNSAFPELDGLKVEPDVRCIKNNKGDYVETIIPLTNIEHEAIELIIRELEKGMSLRVDNKDKEFRVQYSYYKKKGYSELDGMSFVKGNDNIAIRRLFQGCSFVDVFTNTVGSGEVYDKYLLEVMPDYCCTIEVPYQFESNDKTTIMVDEKYSDGYESPRIGLEEIELDTKTQANTLGRLYRITSEKIDEEFHNKYLFEKPKTRVLNK